MAGLLWSVRIDGRNPAQGSRTARLKPATRVAIIPETMPPDGRRLALRTTKAQCINDAALNARADLLLFTDDCLESTRGYVERRMLGG